MRDSADGAWVDIKADIAAFESEFAMRAEIVISSMVNLSEDRVLKEQAHYGLQTTFEAKVTFTRAGPSVTSEPKYSITEGPAKAGMTNAAMQLSQKLREVSRKRDEVFRYQKPMAAYSVELVVTDQQKYDKADQDYKDAQYGYMTMRADRLAQYPLLAKWATGNSGGGTAEIDKSADSLEEIGKGSTATVAQTLNEELNKDLTNIAETRDLLKNHQLNIWKLDTVVAGTKESMGVEDKSLRGRALAEKVAKENWGEAVIKVVVAVLALALGLLAAIPTGGSSLAAGVAVAAAVGSAGLSVGIAYSDFKEYMIQSALAGTDFDKARAISAEEPSLFWLAISIIGAAIDVGAAVKAFQALGPAARAAREAKRLATLGKASASDIAKGDKALDQLVERADVIKKGLGDRLRRNIIEAAGEEARNTERIASHWEEGLTPETKAFLGAEENKVVRDLYHDMDPFLRDLLTHCSKLCIIPNITRAQASRSGGCD